MKVHPREKMVEGKSNVSKKTLRCLQFSRKERGRDVFQSQAHPQKMSSHCKSYMV